MQDSFYLLSNYVYVGLKKCRGNSLHCIDGLCEMLRPICCVHRSLMVPRASQPLINGKCFISRNEVFLFLQWRYVKFSCSYKKSCGNQSTTRVGFDLPTPCRMSNFYHPNQHSIKIQPTPFTTISTIAMLAVLPAIPPPIAPPALPVYSPPMSLKDYIS